jgi:DNA-directed RNA polymerase specialized sigma24 family protein
MSEDFQSYRPLLFSIAYRMTDSAGEVEDIVQDSYICCCIEGRSHALVEWPAEFGRATNA